MLKFSYWDYLNKRIFNLICHISNDNFITGSLSTLTIHPYHQVVRAKG